MERMGRRGAAVDPAILAGKVPPNGLRADLPVFRAPSPLAAKVSGLGNPTGRRAPKIWRFATFRCIPQLQPGCVAAVAGVLFKIT